MKRNINESKDITRATKWLPKYNIGFCIELQALIKSNQGDDSWIESDDKGRIALFRKTSGLGYKIYD